jgi:RNA polymerase primary sigma factor
MGWEIGLIGDSLFTEKEELDAADLLPIHDSEPATPPSPALNAPVRITSPEAPSPQEPFIAPPEGNTSPKPPSLQIRPPIAPSADDPGSNTELDVPDPSEGNPTPETPSLEMPSPTEPVPEAPGSNTESDPPFPPVDNPLTGETTLAPAEGCPDEDPAECPVDCPARCASGSDSGPTEPEPAFRPPPTKAEAPHDADKPLGTQGMRFCHEVLPCPNPKCPVRERQIIRCFKFFEPRGTEEKLRITGGTRVCDQCYYKRGWDLGILNEDLFQDILEDRRKKMARTEQIRRENIVDIYLQELSKKPLSRDEEIQLAKRLAGDRDASELLLLANLKLVVRVSRSFTGRGLQLADLIQEGNLGLVKAISKFDYTLGYRFSTYAAYWIRHYMQKAVSDQARVLRVPHHLLVVSHKIQRTIREMHETLQRNPTLTELAQVLMLEEEKILEIIRISQAPISIEGHISSGDEDEAPLEFFLADKKVLSPEEQAIEKAKIESCRKAIDSLPDRLKHIVELFYGFGPESLSLAEIGRRLGVSRERARQLLKQALDELQTQEMVISLKDFLA